jgi:hypothetical protein
MAKSRKSAKPRTRTPVDVWAMLGKATEDLAGALERDALHKLTHPFAKLSDGTIGELVPAPAAQAA